MSHELKMSYLWAVKTRMRSLPALTPPPLSCFTGHLSNILALAPSARRMDSCMSLVMLRRVDMVPPVSDGRADYQAVITTRRVAVS